MKTILTLTLLFFSLHAVAQVPAGSGGSVPVTPDNFRRAESDMYFAVATKDAGGTGKLYHRREVVPVDKQPVVRPNRDTIYSSGVFDLDAGPVTITMPDPGKRFMSLMTLNEDHYIVDVTYDAGDHLFTKDRVGTRYLFVGIRTLVDPNDPTDVKNVHTLQDAIKITQKAYGRFEAPQWDQESQKKVREALLLLGATAPDFKGAFGRKQDVDPVRHLIGCATGWGGNPDKDATYLNVTPSKNDGSTPYTLVVKDVPVEAFWSISLYNAQGFFEPNKENAYSLNNITARKGSDGTVTIHFGGVNDGKANYLPITKGWNYTVRLYRPKPEVLDGTWVFPDPQPTP